jgi:hypothetical protein
MGKCQQYQATFDTSSSQAFMGWREAPWDLVDSIDEFRPAPLSAFFADPEGLILPPSTDPLSAALGVPPVALGVPTGVLRACFLGFTTPPAPALDAAEVELLPVPPPGPPKRFVPLPVLR